MKSALLSFLLMCLATLASAGESMKLAVTTSFHNSGLAEVLLPRLEADTGITVRLLVVGTGQALKLGRAGDVDAILVHSPAAETAFVSDGYGTHRREIMYNDFVLIGPRNDPAGIAKAGTAAQALGAISSAETRFVSRGDDSGTHKKELSLWSTAAANPDDFGSWYRPTGSGMGAALNTAAAMQAYILSDRASWLNFKNKRDLKLLFAGDPVLFNQYGYIPINPDRHGHVKAGLATRFEAWLTGPTARDLINGYTIDGETLFTFNAKDG